jgi:hypothetical protein
MIVLTVDFVSAYSHNYQNLIAEIESSAQLVWRLDLWHKLSQQIIKTVIHNASKRRLWSTSEVDPKED